MSWNLRTWADTELTKAAWFSIVVSERCGCLDGGGMKNERGRNLQFSRVVIAESNELEVKVEDEEDQRRK